MSKRRAVILSVTTEHRSQASSQAAPVSPDLSRQLQVWSDELTTLRWGPNGPDARGRNGPDPHDLATVNAKGRKLANLVRGELVDSWDVRYFDEELGKVVEVALTQELIRRRHHR